MSLKDRLIRQIRMDGPMPVSAYMQTCLHDPKDGYYANGAGLGRDFITAPETSQMFGELVGLWIVQQWQALGSPATFNLVEMGGGRGTLMADALRAVSSHIPKEAIGLSLIEASPALRDQQAAKLMEYAPNFVAGLHQIPVGPLILIANEFLDCLPVRQFVHQDAVWRERMTGINETGQLVIGVDRSDIASDAAAALEDTEIQAEAEYQPALITMTDQLQLRAVSGQPLRALFIDYGPDDRAPTDTLRAYKNGKQVDPLACPGEADLTVDVDFGQFARLAQQAGLDVAGPVTQGQFLGRLGLQDRLNTLIKSNPGQADALFSGAQKLVAPEQMGTRFKVICISSAGLPTPPGFA